MFPNTRANSSPLPEVMIMEILLRVPVKAVARFNCLSTKWNNTISNDSYFRSRYKALLGGSSVMLGVLYHSYSRCIRFDPNSSDMKKVLSSKKVLDEALNFINAHQGDGIISASSNGFVICSSRKLHTSYLICNLITNQYIFLPRLAKIAKASVGFTCTQDLHCKVVRAIWPTPDRLPNTLAIELFICNKERWKEFNLTCTSDFSIHSKNKVILTESSGSIYLPIVKPNLVDMGKPLGVVTFDHKQEIPSELEMILLPDEAKEKVGTHFGLINGVILWIVNDFLSMELWELDVKGKIWSMKYKVKDPGFEVYLRIEAFHPLDSKVLLVRFLEGKMAWYNVESSRMELIPRSLRSHRSFRICVPSASSSLPSYDNQMIMSLKISNILRPKDSYSDEEMV